MKTPAHIYKTYLKTKTGRGLLHSALYLNIFLIAVRIMDNNLPVE